jgi:hypothetical protein
VDVLNCPKSHNIIENSWMELTEETFLAGDNYVVDLIKTAGA